MEVDHPDLRREGFFFDEVSFKLNLYRLITCFYASVTFAKNGEDIDDDPVINLQGTFEEAEITSLLVRIAISVRIMDEREKHLSNLFKLECGQLIGNINQPEDVIPLTLREACNKIIHTKKFNWDVEQLKDEENLPYPTTRYLVPKMYLYGTKDNKQWKATLDITKFVRQNAALWQG
jgi:hypothetical protein